MIKKALVVGGGVAGMSAAISLRRIGIDVDLAEIDPEWKSQGAGITLTSATLRACKRLGILDSVKRHGATWPFGEIHAPDGRFVGRVQWPAFEPEEPPAGGILRPALHKILSELTRGESVRVRLGATVAELQDTGAAVSVVFSDGSTGQYDLIIGADGIFSSMRERVFPEAPRPAFTGQAVYRIVCERPAEINGSQFYPRHDAVLGCSLVSATHMYLFVLLPMPGNPWLPVEQQPQHLYEKMAGWGGFIADIRERVRHSPIRESINYRPLESVLLPPPWYRGRVLIIGDAAHATTPHLASGAGMAMEDGMVLAEELNRGGELSLALARFQERRFERCRMVVENSLAIGAMEMRGGSPEALSQLMRDTIHKVMLEP